jgi:branched-chain amino acid transport system ATP-binding protein
MDNILALDSITASYHKKEILHNVSINIAKGKIISLIGPNGAGKSTLLKVIAGLLIPKKGEVILNDEKITNLSPDLRTHKGIGYFMQGGEIFQNLTVLENLEMGGFTLKNDFLKQRFEEVFQVFPSLKNIQNKRAGLLSGGQRHLLAIGIILINRPELLLLDEPSAGLAPALVTDILKKARDINQITGATIILVEQNVKEALRISDRVYIMKDGKIIDDGIPDTMVAEKKIEAAFFR